MALLTTTIGSYPKPPQVPVPNWFEIRKLRGEKRWDPTRAYDRYLESQGSDAKSRIEEGTKEIVREQVDMGIDIPTDGEIPREHYIYYHLRHVEGFDFGQLTETSMRGGSWRAEVPTVRRPLKAGSPFLSRDWRLAQSSTDRPVKMTVPGPLTIMDSTADAYYGDEVSLGAALADVLNAEILALADAGCTWIQIDEPVFARYPDAANDRGMDLLARCFHGVPDRVQRVVHVCCGYPSDLDLDDYPKADGGAYLQIADGLEQSPVDVVSLEDAHRHNDMALLERFRRTSVILGVVGIARTRVEPVEEIRERLLTALKHIDAERLMAGPDCGLIMLPRMVARAKLHNIAVAAHGIESG